MNAILRDAPRAADLGRVMARDLLGAAELPRSAIAYHTTLSPLATGGTLGLADGTWPAGTRVPFHVHRDEDEIVVVLSGTLEVRIAGRAFRRNPGETAFIPRGVEHEVVAVTQARHIAILTRRSLEAAPTA